MKKTDSSWNNWKKSMKRTIKKTGKISCVLILAGTLSSQGWFGAAGNSFLGLPNNWTISQVKAAENGPKIVKEGESYITSGAKLIEYKWTSADENRSSTVRVIEIDLTNPHVELNVMTGQNGKIATRNTVRGMAVQTGAVAGVNGDFYVMAGEGAPMGPQVTGGELTASPSKMVGMYAFGITEDNKPIIERFDFSGIIINDQGVGYPLAGINKTNYWTEPDKTHSHVDSIYVYTSDWGQVSRASDGLTTPTEMLVVDDIVQEISVGSQLQMTPPENGYIVRAHRKASDYIVQNFNVGDRVQLDYELKPINPSTSFDANSLKMLIGGHTLLVNEGKNSSYTRDVSSIGGSRARTGVGFSKDGKYAYLITVDGGKNSGIFLGEFRELMVQLGVWKGMNLDGGGSTQLVSRPLGDEHVKLINAPEFGGERSVVNGIGVYTNAPVGPVKDMVLQGKETLLIGEPSSYQLKAYDIYYNPKDMSDAEVTWSTSMGAFSGNVFTAKRPGKVTLTAESDGVERSLEVNVIGFDDVESLQFDVPEQALSAGKSYSLPLIMKTKSGETLSVPASSVEWEFYGFNGTVEDGKIKVNKITNDDGLAQIVARYDGFSTILALRTGVEKLWTDFDQNAPDVSVAVYPNDVEGSAGIVYGLPGMRDEDRVLYLTYDFSHGNIGTTKAVYAVFGDGNGINIDGKPVQMNVRVQGDQSLNWLRAEVIDAKGKKHLVDIERDMNFSGTKTLSADFASYNMSYPIKLSRLYVASPAERQEERAARGSIVIENISFVYPSEESGSRDTELVLKVDSNKMTVNGAEVSLDQAPIVMDGRTLVPIRFISEALKARTFWNQEEKQVTLIDQDNLIQLWIEKHELITNGERAETDVAPIVRNGRTLVPLRMISETFGWDVEWNQKEQTVRLKG